MFGNRNNNGNNGQGTWTDAFDRLTEARENDAPVDELERRASAELDRLTREEG